MLNYPELQKSSLVLYDMAAFYLPLYGRDWEDFFDFFAPLTVVEGLVYQVEIAIDNGQPWDWATQEAKIVAFLQTQNLWLPIMQRYLTELGDYFALVQQLTVSAVATPTDLARVTELRPSDIRLLHVMVARLLDEPHDEELFTLLWPLENLLDLKANLTEYQIDAATGHYNTYNMALKLYGADQAYQLIKSQQTDYQAMLQNLEKTASPRNLTRYQTFSQRHEAAYPSVPIPYK